MTIPMMPTPQAAPGQTPQGTAPAQGQGLAQQWTSYFQTPQVRAAMMQLGVSMLQPRQAGQTVAGQVGTSIADAGGAAARVSEFQRLDAKDKREQARLDQAAAGNAAQLAIDQKRLGLAERAESRAAASDAERVKQQGVENELAKENLALKKQSQKALEGYYAAIAGSKKATNPPGYDDALDVVKQAAALEDDPVAFFIQEKTRLDQQFGLTPGPQVSPTAGGGAGTPLPQDKAAEILKAQPTPENRKYFDEVYGAGSAAKILGK